MDPITTTRPDDRDRAQLRLTTFRPRDRWHELDRYLRRLMPLYAQQRGHLSTWVGRRAGGPVDDHVLVSLWASRSEAEEAFEIPAMLDLQDQWPAAIADARAEVLPVQILEVFPRPRPMSILRIFRGRTHPGQLEAYLTEALAGTIVDGARPDGPGALACATDGAGGFVTASLWPDWPAIEACTGGDIRLPLATRNAARLESGEATHFELVTYELPEAVDVTPRERSDTGPLTV
jgi:hypothetical protein